MLKKIREKVRMSIIEAAMASGYTKSTISLLENGKRNGGIYTINDILNAYGYELKIVKKGLFDQDVIEWNKELPEEMEPDPEADEGMVAEFGRPIRTKEEYLIVSEDGEVFRSRLYLFEDGKIESNGYYNEKPMCWLQAPKTDDLP